jgi:hypothetical protein
MRAHLVLEALDVQHQHLRQAVQAQVLGGGGLLAAPLAVERLGALPKAAEQQAGRTAHTREVAKTSMCSSIKPMCAGQPVAAASTGQDRLWLSSAF